MKNAKIEGRSFRPSSFVRGAPRLLLSLCAWAMCSSGHDPAQPLRQGSVWVDDYTAEEEYEEGVEHTSRVTGSRTHGRSQQPHFTPRGRSHKMTPKRQHRPQLYDRSPIEEMEGKEEGEEEGDGGSTEVQCSVRQPSIPQHRGQGQNRVVPGPAGHRLQLKGWPPGPDHGLDQDPGTSGWGRSSPPSVLGRAGGWTSGGAQNWASSPAPNASGHGLSLGREEISLGRKDGGRRGSGVWEEEQPERQGSVDRWRRGGTGDGQRGRTATQETSPRAQPPWTMRGPGSAPAAPPPRYLPVRLNVPSKPTFTASDRAYLKPEQRVELSRLLHTGRCGLGGGQVLLATSLHGRLPCPLCLS